MQPIDRYLDVLGLKRGASKADLKAAYRALVQISHPDRFHDNEALRTKAEGQTKLLNEAYKYLSSHIDRVSRVERSEGRAPSAPADDGTGRARREEEKKRQDAEYRKRKALREAREAQQRQWDRRRKRYDQHTFLLGVVFVILLVLYASYARQGGAHPRMVEFPPEAVETETE